MQLVVDEKPVLLVPVNTNSKISLSFSDFKVETRAEIATVKPSETVTKQVENPPEPNKPTTRSPPLPKAYSQYQLQHEQLCKMGFTKIHKNLTVLRQTNGDLPKALEILMQSISQNSPSPIAPITASPVETTPITIAPDATPGEVEPVLENDSSSEEENQLKPDTKLGLKHRMVLEKYREQCEALLQRGHVNLRRNLNVLTRCSGDLDQALAILEKSRANKPQKHSPGWKESNRTPDRAQAEHRQKERKNHLPEKFANLQSQYSEQLASLNQRGFCNQRKNMILLQRTNGDLALTLNLLAKKNNH